MTEERTSIIEVGDIAINSDGVAFTIAEVVRGKHGLRLKSDSLLPGYAYAPYEMPPVSRVWDWVGWGTRGQLTLPNGAKIGTLTMKRHWNRYPIEELDAEWNRTIEAGRAEEGVMQSRPTGIRLNG